MFNRCTGSTSKMTLGLIDGKRGDRAERMSVSSDVYLTTLDRPRL